MGARLTFLGAAGGVTGSCYLLEHGGVGLLIDCGLFQGDADADAKNRAPLAIDGRALAGCVLTHGHLDHVGRLPLLAGRGFAGEVIGHAATLDIARIILPDSTKIAGHADGPPLYGAAEVEAMAERMAPMAGYRRARAVGPFTVELFDAGHILGSASVRVSWTESAGERAILFSGDLGVVGAPILRDPFTAWDPARHAVDWVVTESTYGDRAHPPRDETRATLRDTVRRALDDGGKVLIPAFSIGRTQEVLYELNALVEAGELPGIPVFVDGPLGLSATKIYARHRDCYDAEATALLDRGDHPLEFDHLYGAEQVAASRKAVGYDGAAIIVAGSGMCQGGRIRHHLERHLPDPRTDVLLVGYQASGTLGAALQRGADEVWLRGQRVPVRARITTVRGMSAHADRDGLTAWLGAVPRRSGAQVFVTHGEPEAAAAHAARVRDRFGVGATVPALHQTVELS
ncbi:MAG: MBL fold metallo-hydrolase [Kofleriaceae bacterium]